ncbi:hypothetical protein AB0K12_34895 [Nonomuraea sp. NPDC049419]|uniref:hypothetical protein n=1 Tax=Nonomuraea sp. NPDC049419 TaxID=3155772 RepID=UPI00342DADF0
MMYGAHDTVVIGGKAIGYPAIYRVVRDASGGVVQGRRYYGRYSWFARRHRRAEAGQPVRRDH